MAIYGSNYSYGDSPVYMDDGIVNATIIISDPANIFFEGLNVSTINISNILVDFIGIPQVGSSPLTVDFEAMVYIEGIRNHSQVSAYDWYFDFDNNSEIYERTTLPKITHIFTGYYGKQYSIKLVVKFINSP